MIVATSFGMFMPALRPPNTLGDDNRELQVRSRRKVDLERLRELYLPELGEVIQLKGTDYQFRAYCTREQWGQALAKIAGDIDYLKFKDTPKTKFKDAKLANCYASMWNSIFQAFPTGSVYDWKGWSKGKGKSKGTVTPTFVFDDEPRHYTPMSQLTQRQRDRLWDEKEPEIWELEESQADLDLWNRSEEERRQAAFQVLNRTNIHALCDHADTRAARKRCNRNCKG